MTARTPSVSCVFVCHDGAGRILLARRSTGARDEAGAWDCGAGAIEFGETFANAVSREVTEEYRADIIVIKTIGVRNILRNDPPSHWVAVIFAVQIDPDTAHIGEPHKFNEIGWFSPVDLPSPLHSQLHETIVIFRDWQQHGHRFSPMT